MINCNLFSASFVLRVYINMEKIRELVICDCVLFLALLFNYYVQKCLLWLHWALQLSFGVIIENLGFVLSTYAFVLVCDSDSASADSAVLSQCSTTEEQVQASCPQSPPSVLVPPISTPISTVASPTSKSNQCLLTCVPFLIRSLSF